MIFNTIDFFIFFVIFLIGYYSLNTRWQNVLLVVGSYVFYGWWDWRFCTLLFFSTVVDFYCGLKIPGKHGRFWVYLSVIFQIGMLGFFKYWNFFQESMQAALQGIGVEASWPFLNVILPVGISFYTFQTLSYTIDLYRKKIEVERDFINFAAFVSFWPHLVAGPILRASYMLPQIRAARIVGSTEISQGTYFILVGLVKKVAVADIIAEAIQPALVDPTSHSSWSLLLANYLFFLRIYCDFCGYTDIARGVSLYMGFRLAENFRFPLFATSITDFWRRWHISLSLWLRDYLYISLGGNRHGKWNTYRNLMITMMLGGLWHGASLSFLIWGALHGFGLSVERVLGEWWQKHFSARSFSRLAQRASVIFRWFLAFHLVTFSLIIFVITDLSVAWQYVQGLLAFTYTPDPDRVRLFLYATAVILAIDVPEFISGAHEYLTTKPRIIRGAFYAACIALLIVTWTRNYEPFIYFQF